VKKNRQGLKNKPKKFRMQMEANMQTATCEASLSDSSCFKFCKENMPVGKQRVLGYMTHLLCHLHAAQTKGNTEEARLLTMSGLMALDQFSIDGHWETAWRLTGLSEPPWHSWAERNVEELKKEYRGKSQLAEKMWLAALIAESKDDDYLASKRKGGKG
jgi:hypothetical protein